MSMRLRVWSRRGRWWAVAVILVVAAPLPVTAAGILVAEQGSTLRAMLVGSVAIVTAAACVWGVTAAVRTAAVTPAGRR